MNRGLCPVGYTNQVSSQAKLKGGFQVGTQCLVSWIESKATVEFIPKFVNKFERDAAKAEIIPGINVECEKNLEGNHLDENADSKHNLGYKEGFEFLQISQNQESSERFSLGMLNLITINEKDFRKCPKSDGDYIGTLDLKPSRQLLSGEKGNFEWSDPALYPFCKRFILKVQNCFSYNSDTLNNLQKVLKGEPGPNCGICIIKLDGGNHMVCGKGNYEFCWYCLGHYPSYSHTEFTFGPIRKLVMYVFIVFFLFQSINGKICLLSDTLTQYEIAVMDWVGFLIIANIYAGIGLLFFGLLSETMSYYRMMGDFDEWAISGKSKFYWNLIYCLVYLVVYISCSVVLFIHSEYFYSMLKCLGVEAVILVILFLLVAIVLCLVFVFKGVFGQVQEIPQPKEIAELQDIAQPQEYYQNYRDVDYNSLSYGHPSLEEPLILRSVENRGIFKF